MTATENHLKLQGIEFTEFSSEDPKALHELFMAFGFSRIMRHESKKIDLYQQNDVVFLLNYEPQSFGTDFYRSHGPCVSAMGWRVEDATFAHDKAVERGAKSGTEVGDYTREGNKIPSIYGIGDSQIYFIDNHSDKDRYERMGFKRLENPDIVDNLGFHYIDHLTNNVEKGSMEKWSKFYKEIFGFTEVRYFDIRGVKTGLQSFALRSPDGSFCIPINEGTESKSQINEYLEEYKGPGVQHIALLTNDIVKSVSGMQKAGIITLDIDDEYYQEVFDRVPNVTEDHKALKDLQILVDGDDEGYLLQIFTKNIIGPIFFEIIQRKNHLSFGEGNFGALFRSIERDQQKRGYLDE
jgi:4-hydroxyphenylpyruvate dioxygenase